MDVHCHHWGVVRQAYTGASRKRVLRETWGVMSIPERLIFIIGCMLFFGFLVTEIVTTTWHLFFGMLGAEILVLWIFSEMNDRLLVDEYDFSTSTVSPVERQDHQLTRYLAFKKRLELENVSQDEARSCIELVDQVIAMTQVGGIPGKALLGFLATVAAGIVSTVAMSKDVQLITVVLYAGILALMFLWLLSIFVPSR